MKFAYRNGELCNKEYYVDTIEKNTKEIKEVNKESNKDKL